MNSVIRKQINSDGFTEMVLNPIGKLFADSDYFISLSVCGDPMCNCGSAQIKIIKKENRGTSDIEHIIPIEVHEEIVEPKFDKKSFSKEEKMNYVPDLLANSLTKEDWYVLRSAYFDLKFKIGEAIDPKKVEFEFEDEDYEDISLMFLYQDALPCSPFTLLSEDDTKVFNTR